MVRPKPPPAALHGTPDEIEAQFYEAMQSADLERLMAVWSDDDEVVCVHPGGEQLVGAAAIRASFEALFAVGPVPVQPGQLHRIQAPACEVHHLVERVQAGAGREAFALATNVFVDTGLGWRMVAHHASPASAHMLSESAAGGPATLH
ncbi:MAG: nuclear transport factor 2 family protein [Burkholderiales bacterium]|nr:nuclear transport factor 2 family protein [Burkholderiales bacterium]MDE2455405.1 nuclear transport factor 2 family protein [Burkholderiales bacterium]